MQDAAKETSADAAGTAGLLNLGGIFTLKAATTSKGWQELR